MKTPKRWMASVIAQSKQDAPTLPFERATRKPAVLRLKKVAVKRAAA